MCQQLACGCVAASPPDVPHSVEPLGLLAVDHHALPSQQDMQTTVAVPAPLVGQIAQLLTQRTVVVSDGTIALTLAIGIDDTARARRSPIP